MRLDSTKRLFALVLPSALLLAGCAGAPADDSSDSSDSDVVTPREELLRHLASIPEPVYSIREAVDWWESYVKTYPKRDNGLPNNAPAAEHLRQELEDAGFDARIIFYNLTADPDQAAVQRPVPVRVVEAIRPGTETPDRWVGLISHYDTQSGTIEGAYDDGSGVAVEMTLCKLLAHVETRKTISCLFFDAEEAGLVGSARYVNDRVASGDVHYDQAFGYDMVGLNWPGYSAWKLYAMAGLDTQALQDYMPENLDFLNVTIMHFLGARLGLNASGVEIIPVHDRNSDEQNFKREEVPVVRFAGGRHAGDYPGYHEANDTVEFVYEFAGGRENFEAGFDMVVRVSYYTILAYDAYDPKDLPRLA